MDDSNVAGEARRKRLRDNDDDVGSMHGRNNPRYQIDDIPKAVRASSATPSRRRLRHKDYTVAWICALPKERAAATAMLDQRHESLPRLPGDTNSYSFGSIGQHNIVITCLPSGHYGTVNAAVVAKDLSRSFPLIAFRLMVGIGGGVPSIPNVDIRLGDIIVGHAVLQYDLGKTAQGGGFRCTSHPVKAPPAMLTVVSDLRASHEHQQTRIPAILSEVYNYVPGMKHYMYPKDCPDRFFGNRVIRHAESRDAWAKDSHILCFEMEAAGLIDHFPCLVVRGICDYCDSHKSEEWQEYAAITAAGYAKELLLAREATSCLNPKTATPIERELGPEEEANLINELFLSLQFDQMDDRYQNIKKAHPKTCKWLLHHKGYCDWMDPGEVRQHGGFLWIKGKPGSGKSTIMKFVVENSWKENHQQATVSFFFHARGHDLEKSTAGLYRSILFQILEHYPKLRTILKPQRKFRHFRSGLQPKWTNELLKELIEEAIEQFPSSVVCFVDALDECNDDEIRDMISFFERLGELAIANSVGLLICFSSRHYPYITMREGIGLEINLEEQDDHDADIAEYIDSDLRIGDTKLAQDIKKEVREKASGVFMWVVLVVHILNRERGRLHALRQKIQEIPQDLNALFLDIMSHGREKNDETLLCFQLILVARWPLTPDELHFAIISQAKDIYLEAQDLDSKEAQIFLTQCSKGLAEVIGPRSTVQFIHESVRDFLLQDNKLSDLWPQLGDNPIGSSHLLVRNICLAHLYSEPSEYDRLRTSPFFNYAAENVLFHAEKAASFGIQQPEFISTFPNLSWIWFHNMSRDTSMDIYDCSRYPDDARCLYIMAEADASSLLASYPSVTDCFEIGPEIYGCPLLAAIINESQDFIQVLRKKFIESFPADSFPEIDCRASTVYDLAFGLRYKFHFTSSERSLISYLAEYGDPVFLVAAIQQTSENSGLQQNISSEDAISVATYLGHESAVRVLLHYGKGDVDYLSETGQTSLSMAAEDGKIEIMKLVLATGKVDPNTRDYHGKSPLSWAAENGQNEAIKLILAIDQVDPETRDDEGRTPLALAAKCGQIEAIKLLLATGQVDPDSRDNEGRTPLALAVAGGQIETMRLLLVTGDVDPNSRDHFGQSLLILAVDLGQTKAIELLLATNQVDPNAKDLSGKTPLALAIQWGQTEVVKLLLAMGQVSLDLRDNRGQSPLALAVECGQTEDVKLLLATGQVDLNSRDDRGQTPLDLAVERGQTEDVELLLATGQTDPTS
ncbi:unnamed protein product [Clonostachys rosea]|uniref:Nucleoside phosphorylase domain-containing protein n=1 Tax=Bionectria ochroleuca TaxID=29856 RepID=A0ABY6V309_BIOOC|nr:unnamed protein product [Clonostachys rosea]